MSKQATVNAGPQQKDFNFQFRLGDQVFKVNEHTTIQELDEAIIAINEALAKEKSLIDVKRRIYQFMRQHHSFDLYIEDCHKKAGQA